MNELLTCANDLLDTVYKLHPNGPAIRETDTKKLQGKISFLGADVFDPDKTVRRIIQAREILKKYDKGEQ